MLRYQNITLLGTSHIAIESIEAVKATIQQEKPSIVAIELDRARLNALLNDDRKKPQLRVIRRIGIKGYIFARIGFYVEHKLGSIVGVSPGTEMLTAYKLAQETHARIALIDQPIDITLRRFSKALTWKEKFRFAKDILTSPFKKEKITFDLRTVPTKALVKKMVDEVQKKYPNVYTTLILERNIYMAQRLHQLLHTNETILAVVGAGHEEEILQELQRLHEHKEKD